MPLRQSIAYRLASGCFRNHSAFGKTSSATGKRTSNGSCMMLLKGRVRDRSSKKYTHTSAEECLHDSGWIIHEISYTRLFKCCIFRMSAVRFCLHGLRTYSMTEKCMFVLLNGLMFCLLFKPTGTVKRKHPFTFVIYLNAVPAFLEIQNKLNLCF